MIQQTAKKPDRREYTLMIVPHHGKSVLRLTVPIQLIKAAAAVLGIFCAVMVGAYFNTYFNYREVAHAASAERSELEQLRTVNARQAQQIDELAQATAVLQEDMTRLNQLDSELRRLVNSEESSSVSRSANRPSLPGGQGGPAVKPQVQQLNGLVQELQAAAKERQQSLQDLKETLLYQKAQQAVTPSIWPASGEVTSRFGWRSSPWGGGGGDWHPGIDIAGSYGTPIYAAADGYVVSSAWNSGGYGNLVEIDHGNGIVTLYGHNSQNVALSGSRVKKGDLIAYMGSTGASTGTHLHYEVRVNGTAVNPASFLH